MSGSISKRTRRIYKLLLNIPVVLVVSLAFLLCGLQLFGLTPYSILSGSMASVYPTGSLIYVAKAEPSQLEVNDIITFRMAGGTVATHRIVELVSDENQPETVRFRTKGDENEVTDGPLVSFQDVIGTPLFGIPYLGYLATYISTSRGKLVALTVVLAIMLLEIIFCIVFDDKKESENQGEKGASV